MPTPIRAHISGTEGHIQVEGSFYAPTSFTLTRNDGARWSFARASKQGLPYEAAELARCVAAGRTESERMTWDGTLQVMATMDEVRRQIGLAYPGE